jgi:hypothetical protein
LWARRGRTERQPPGTSSSDPDDDIASWSIDFADGMSMGGHWPMPAEVTHDYGQHACLCAVLLTLTDSAAHTGSDPMVVNIDNHGLD